MKAKLVFISFIILLTYFFLHADSLRIPFQFRELQEGRYAPSSYVLNENIIYLLQENIVYEYSLEKSRFIREIKIPDYAENICLNNNEFGFLSGRNVYITSLDGTIRNKFRLPSGWFAAWRITHFKGHWVVIDPKGFWQSVDGTNIRGLGYPVNENESISIIRTDSGFYFKNKFFNLVNRGSIIPFAKDKSGNYYIYAEKVYSKSPILAQGFIYIADESGNTKAIVELPLYPYAFIKHNFFMDTNGIFHILLANKHELVLFSLTNNELKGYVKLKGIIDSKRDAFWETRVRETTFPEPDNGFVSITRDQIMANAVPYESHEWYANTWNITYGTKQDNDGKYICTPSWVTEGYKEKIPYQWGGFSSIAGFDTGLATKYAGDNYTDKASASNYCIGVDCSGFVSRAWGTTQKYGTSTIPNISEELPSYNDMKRGDCLNNAGSHVRLCAEDNPENSVLTLEASGVDWRVSYRTYNFSSLSGYIPRKYNGTEEESDVRPFVVKVVGIEELPVRKQADTYSEEICKVYEGQEFVCTSYKNNWYRIYIPSGTGTTSGWCYGGNGDNGYLTGHLETDYVKVKPFAMDGVLNVRSGPGTNYPIITTISTGQMFTITESSGYWYHINIANVPDYKTGWSSAGSAGEYLDIIRGGYSGKLGAKYLNQQYPSRMSYGEKSPSFIEFENIGENSWNSETLLATTMERDRESVFYTEGNWISKCRPAKPNRNALPGQKAVFMFILTAPMSNMEKEYIENWGLVQESYAWFSDSGHFGPPDDQVWFKIDVGSNALSNFLTPQEISIPFKIGEIYPQPCRTESFIRVSLPEAEKISISYYDIRGRLVRKKNSCLNKGYGTLRIERMKSGGIFFLKIKTSRGVFLRKLVQID
ncbi:MAG: SH3 domain-containing protein [Candidatus Coatesbacteria bacterium]|nr:SH3 domain-containing protein [Candidatus Coatesbacteria bacterium]